MTLVLVAINEDGSVDGDWAPSPHAAAVFAATAENYRRAGFQPPWICYLCFSEGQNVGTCGFKAPASGYEAEIAYYTFPEFEGRGFARQAAQSLIGIARSADPDIVLTAQTLPTDGASPSILRKEGFINREMRSDPEAGDVWHWVLEPASAGREQE